MTKFYNFLKFHYILIEEVATLQTIVKLQKLFMLSCVLTRPCKQRQGLVCRELRGRHAPGTSSSTWQELEWECKVFRNLLAHFCEYQWQVHADPRINVLELWVQTKFRWRFEPREFHEPFSASLFRVVKLLSKDILYLTLWSGNYMYQLF